MIYKSNNSKKEYKYLIFDFDGTINDTSEGIVATFKKVLDKFGVDYSKVDFNKHIGPPLDFSFRELVGGDNWQEALKLYRKTYVDDDAGKQSCLYDGIEQTLKTLYEKGYLLAVATSKYEPFAVESLKYFKIDKYFRFVYGQNERRGYKNEILAQLIADNGWNKADCLMIGDTCYDVDGARENGIDVLAVSYGFEKREVLMAHAPDILVDLPSEIVSALDE